MNTRVQLSGLRCLRFAFTFFVLLRPANLDLSGVL